MAPQGKQLTASAAWANLPKNKFIESTEIVWLTDIFHSTGRHVSLSHEKRPPVKGHPPMRAVCPASVSVPAESPCSPLTLTLSHFQTDHVGKWACGRQATLMGPDPVGPALLTLCSGRQSTNTAADSRSDVSAQTRVCRVHNQRAHRCPLSSGAPREALSPGMRVAPRTEEQDRSGVSSGARTWQQKRRGGRERVL